MDGHRFEEIEKFSHMLAEKGIVIPKDLKLAVIVEDRAFRENVPAQHWNTKDLELNTASGHRFYLLREKGAYEQGIDLGGGKSEGVMKVVPDNSKRYIPVTTDEVLDIAKKFGKELTQERLEFIRSLSSSRILMHPHEQREFLIEGLVKTDDELVDLKNTSEQVPCLFDILKVAKGLKFEIETSHAELVQKRYMEIVGDSEEDNWSIVVENILYNLFGKNKG